MSPLQIKIAAAAVALLLLVGFGRAVWIGQQVGFEARIVAQHQQREAADAAATLLADSARYFLRGRVYQYHLDHSRHAQLSRPAALPATADLPRGE